MGSSLDVMHRYLKSREPVNENARLLATLIEAGRGIDAVELDDKEQAKHLLDSSELSYCLVNVDGHLLLLYPTEQREQYMNLRPFLELGDQYVELTGFTYSEAESARDLFDAAHADYRTSMDVSGRITFAVPKQSAALAQNVADTIRRELDTDEGRNYFISRNIYWQHAVNQASIAASYTGVSFIGSEGGSSGIRIDESGATVFATKKPQKFISRADSNFDRKVISAIMNDLNGAQRPVKAFHGEFADIMTEDLSGMSKNEALDVLDLDEIPDIEECEDLYENLDSYDERESSAFYSLLRMSMCRSQKLEDSKKMSKRDTEMYKQMHLDNINLFAGFAREMGVEKERVSGMVGIGSREEEGENHEK